jgi:predicted alpha/beta-hydrolase family hydrolase
MSKVEQFHRSCEDEVNVRGFLHTPSGESLGSLVLTHGAGGNANGALLVALATAFADAGFTVLRCDLPFRQAKPFGPPSPSSAARDQMGLRCAAIVLREIVPGRVFIGGQSYGGRQATLLAASDESVCDGLLLLSYPLHPPGKPERLRTEHFPKLRKPALFVQGTKDPFGSVSEMESALKLISTPHEHLVIEGAGHDLGWSRRVRPEFLELPAKVVGAFPRLFLSNPIFP